MQKVLRHKVRGLASPVASTGPGGALYSSWITGPDEMGQQLCDVELHRPVFRVREGLVPDEVSTAARTAKETSDAAKTILGVSDEVREAGKRITARVEDFLKKAVA